MGDKAYYTQTVFGYGSVNNAVSDGDSLASWKEYSSIYEIGAITSVGDSYIEVASNVDVPTNAFLMFAKDPRANISGLTGYYANIKLSNSSHAKAELFSVSSEAVESSK